MQIVRWWEGKSQIEGVEMSRSEVRHERLQAIAYFTMHFLEQNDKLKALSEKIIKSENKDEVCGNAASTLALVMPDAKEVVDKYKMLLAPCWTFQNLIQTTILCDSCNSKMQKSLTLDSNKIFLNKASCDTIGKTCFDIAKLNLKTIFPYLIIVEV